MRSLKYTLDRFYREYNFRERIFHDPIEFPHRYRNREDIEVSGFIASCLAYGKVELFKPVVEKILSLMGKHPSSFLRDFDVRKERQRFTFKYRFNESLDILCLLFIMHELLEKYSSVETAFKNYYASDDPDTGKGITGLAAEIMSINTSVIYGRNIRPHGMTHFFPSPAKGSACKRMNLFLRWMVRDRDIDFGIWKGIPRNKLVIPLDVHIAKISQCLGFTTRTSADWKAAREITEALKKLAPDDPLKYDFALCHHGISGLCEANIKRRRSPAGDVKIQHRCRDCVFDTYRKTKTA